MGFTADLLSGVAQLLDTQTSAVYDPFNTYDDTQVGIILGPPTQTPPSQVTLAAYGNTDDPVAADSVVQVQARYRSPDARPGPADDLADEVFMALQGLHGKDLIGGVHVVYCKRNSSLPLGVDGNGRWERSDNYDLMVHRPSAHRE